MRYVLENPVRKQMVTSFEDYAGSGSDTYTVDQLRQLWQVQQG